MFTCYFKVLISEVTLPKNVLSRDNTTVLRTDEKLKKGEKTVDVIFAYTNVARAESTFKSCGLL